MQGLHIGPALGALRQHLRGPADHRKGIGVDDRALAQNPCLAGQMVVQDRQALAHQLAARLLHIGLGFLVLTGRIAIGHEQRVETGMQVAGEEAGPAVQFRRAACAGRAGQIRFGMLVRQIVQDGAGLRQDPAVILDQGGHRTRRVHRQQLL